MRSRVLLAIVASLSALACVSCGSDDATEVVQAPDAASDTGEAAAPDGGGAEAQAPETSLPDTSVEDSASEVDSAEEASIDALPETSADAAEELAMSFQHAAGFAVTGWNADGTGKEPLKVGYSIPQPYAACMPSGTAVALAYLASADYDGILAGCPGSVQGNPAVPPIGFNAFVGALGTASKSLTDVAIRFEPIVLESPSTFPGNPEQRVYKGGTFVLYVSGEPMVQATGDAVDVVVDYKDGADCNDDVVEATTRALTVTDRSASSGDDVKSLATAFLADVAGRKVRLRFVGFQALAPFSSAVEGRTGATFRVDGGGRLELAP